MCKRGTRCLFAVQGQERSPAKAQSQHPVQPPAASLDQRPTAKECSTSDTHIYTHKHTHFVRETNEPTTNVDGHRQAVTRLWLQNTSSGHQNRESHVARRLSLARLGTWGACKTAGNTNLDIFTGGGFTAGDPQCPCTARQNAPSLPKMPPACQPCILSCPGKGIRCAASTMTSSESHVTRACRLPPRLRPRCGRSLGGWPPRWHHPPSASPLSPA